MSVTVRVRRCISTTVCGQSHGIEDFRVSRVTTGADSRFKLRQTCGKRDCGPQDQTHNHHHLIRVFKTINSLFFSVEVGTTSTTPISRGSVKASHELLGQPRNTPMAPLPTHIHLLRFLLPRQASFDIGAKSLTSCEGVKSLRLSDEAVQLVHLV